MPKSWYIWKENMISDDDDDETIAKKELYRNICAHKKPYFFQWNYTSLHSDYCKYKTNANEKCNLLFGKSLNEVLKCSSPSLEEQKFIEMYYNKCDLDFSPSTMNRICWKIEDAFDGSRIRSDVSFDRSIFKTNKVYQENDYKVVLNKCKEYKNNLAKLSEQLEEKIDNAQLLSLLVQDLHSLVFDEDDLCNILIDLCYSDLVNKQIMWETCGEIIVNRLLKTHHNKISYPVLDNEGEFECCGHRFHMVEIEYDGGEIDVDI